MAGKASREMPARNVRVPDHIWEPAAARAEHRGDNLSAVIRRALAEYAKPRAGEPATTGSVPLFGGTGADA